MPFALAENTGLVWQPSQIELAQEWKCLLVIVVVEL